MLSYTQILSKVAPVTLLLQLKPKHVLSGSASARLNQALSSRRRLNHTEGTMEVFDNLLALRNLWSYSYDRAIQLRPIEEHYRALDVGNEHETIADYVALIVKDLNVCHCDIPTMMSDTGLNVILDSLDHEGTMDHEGTIPWERFHVKFSLGSLLGKDIEHDKFLEIVENSSLRLQMQLKDPSEVRKLFTTLYEGEISKDDFEVITKDLQFDSEADFRAWFEELTLSEEYQTKFSTWFEDLLTDGNLVRAAELIEPGIVVEDTVVTAEPHDPLEPIDKSEAVEDLSKPEDVATDVPPSDAELRKAIQSVAGDGEKPPMMTPAPPTSGGTDGISDASVSDLLPGPDEMSEWEKFCHGVGDEILFSVGGSLLLLIGLILWIHCTNRRWYDCKRQFGNNI